MKTFLSLLAFGLAALLLPLQGAVAGASCNNKPVSAFGNLGGGPFNVPADTRSLTGPSENFVALQSEDCDRFDDARKKSDQAGANAAALDVYGLEEGLNLTANYVNSNFNEDGHAVGLNLSYHLDQGAFGADAWVQGVSFTVGGATGTNWDDQIVKVGGNIAFGSLF